MRFAPHLLDEIRARLPVSQVVGRKVALKRAGREYKGLSPFKVERTPSFTVNDQKGFYHCFASGEHGDIFKFVMVTEGLSFPEAVERLAAEAGVTLPKPEARDLAQEDERQRLLAVMEASVGYFEACLRSGAGAEARRYVERRGLKRETLAAFRIGFAPSERNGLEEHLSKAGYTRAEMIAAGMLIAGPDIPTPYDRFRNRIMFPIQDLKGRTIAFGGRALDAGAPAKYLNSPETPLFHKGHVLFNAHRARPLAHDKGRVIAVEGYMDAIALSEAGFGECVAPLGTALTEDQVKLLWRLAPEPILCFDGDSAGLKAAYRAVDTVLPHLVPGFSVAFAFLPDGLDPDDLVRQQGPGAFEEVLARTRPLVQVLFEREWQQGDWSTPERRARLDSKIREIVGRIGEPSVRGHYARALADRLARAWQGASGFARAGSPGARAGRLRTGQAAPSWTAARGRGALPPPRPGASPSLRASAMVAGEGAAVPHREALILKAVLNHPWLIDAHAEVLADLTLTSSALSRLRDAILSAHAVEKSLDRTVLRDHLSKSGAGRSVDLVDRAMTHRCDRFAEPNAEAAEVEDGWRHALELHELQVGLRRSLEAAERQWHEDRSEVAFVRIREIQAQLARLGQAESLDGGAESEIAS